MSNQQASKEGILPEGKLELGFRQSQKMSGWKIVIVALVIDRENIHQSFRCLAFVIVIIAKLIIGKFRIVHLNWIFRTERQKLDISCLYRNIPCVVIHILEEEGRVGRSSLKQLWMVTYFPQLHHQVHQILYFRLWLKHLEQFLHIQLLFNRVIQKFLSLCHLT